jgi:hypothetical protein
MRHNTKQGTRTMSAKTLRILSAAGIVASLFFSAGPAWAHYEHRHGHGPRYVHPYRPAVVVIPPVVRYGYAPAPVYYVPPPAYVPAPAYYGRPAYAPWGTIGGAVAGAAIGSGLGQGNGRTAAIAVGSVVGAVIGGQLAAGR